MLQSKVFKNPKESNLLSLQTREEGEALLRVASFLRSSGRGADQADQRAHLL
jgi:hypothetical protein